MKPDILKDKKIIVGITGGIAAYKSCYLIRGLKSRGADIKVLMTPSALQFITPLTLSALSGNEVVVNIFPENQQNGTSAGTWHIEYGLWADLMIVAPATVNTIAKLSYGITDNALTTVASALRCPLVIAPAADMDMYNSQANMENLERLRKRDVFIVEGESGFLASGLTGPGRMADVSKIIDAAETVISGISKDLTGKKVVITAGPTFEDIDPVRFIGNRSSGKMGYQLAKAAFLRGAEVTLISGPINLPIYPEIKIQKVRSASEMQAAVKSNIKGKDILIMAAAVADYRPSEYASEKIKKEQKLKSLTLVENDDILKSLKAKNTKIVGFALETENAVKNAFKKLDSKNLDMIILNVPDQAGSGFEYDTNKVTIIKKDKSQTEYEIQSKFQTAHNILSEIKKLFI